jgi:hypothetical protein
LAPFPTNVPQHFVPRIDDRTDIFHSWAGIFIIGPDHMEDAFHINRVDKITISKNNNNIFRQLSIWITRSVLTAVVTSLVDITSLISSPAFDHPVDLVVLVGDRGQLHNLR